MHRGVTDSTFNVKPLFSTFAFLRACDETLSFVTSNKVWPMAIDSHGQDWKIYIDGGRHPDDVRFPLKNGEETPSSCYCRETMQG
jgi:hypothetical protein